MRDRKKIASYEFKFNFLKKSQLYDVYERHLKTCKRIKIKRHHTTIKKSTNLKIK